MAVGKRSVNPTLVSMTLLLTIVAVGCAQGHCRRLERKATIEGKDSLNDQDTNLPQNTRQLKVYKKRVYIFKYDGTKQCQVQKGISLEKMKQELSPIEILSSQKKNDGFIRIQVCGSDTGNANVFEIYEDDLESALAKGFKLWKVH